MLKGGPRHQVLIAVQAPATGRAAHGAAATALKGSSSSERAPPKPQGTPPSFPPGVVSSSSSSSSPSPFVPVLAGVLVPERRTARENARLEIGSRRGRNSHQMGVLGIYDLQGLSYGRTELLVADMRLLAPDPSGAPRGGRCH